MSHSEKNVQHIAAEIHRGLVGSSLSCIGLHGTSVQTLIQAIDTGYIPGAGSNNFQGPDFPQVGDLYYCPFPTRRVLELYGPKLQQDLRTYSPSFDAENYAGDISRSHFVLSMLGLSLDDGESEDYARDFTDHNDGISQKQAKEYFLKSFSPTILDKVENAAKRISGIVLGIHEDALYEYIDDYGDQGGIDRRLHTNIGFAIGFVRGVRVLDPISNGLLTRRLQT